MGQVHLDRLRKLADFLETGRFGDIENFCFSGYVNGLVLKNNREKSVFYGKGYGRIPVPRMEPYICGTSACAMGFTPIVFPEDIRYIIHSDDSVNAKFATIRNEENWENKKWNEIGMDFFDLALSQFEVLFVPDPYATEPKPYDRVAGLLKLPPNATAKQVAVNIKNFVKYEQLRESYS